MESTPSFNLEFYSGPLTNASGLQTFSHGFGIVPKKATVQMECITADIGYSVGDFMDVGVAGIVSGTNNQMAFQVSFTNSQLFLTTADTLAFKSMNKSTGAAANMTGVRWRVHVYAWA